LAPTQIDRPFRFKTPLGDDALLLESFTGEERVSTPYRFTLQLLAEDPDIDMKALMMKPAVLTIKLEDDAGQPERHIHGILNRMKLTEMGKDGMARYQAEMVPWLWFLTLYSNCRIFQNKSVPDIVEQVFTDRGFTDYQVKLQGTYQPREYCVQYRETDFNFVSRLLEDEGIFYFFEQTEEKHTLVLADAISGFEACPNKPTATYTPSVGAGSRLNEDTVLSIEEEHRVNTGKTTLTDYDFEKPHTNLDANLSGSDEGQSDETGECYDYPGKYKTKDDGDRYVKLRLEEREVALVTVFGKSNCMGFECGYKFTLSEHFREKANQDYTLTALRHFAQNTSYRAGVPDPFEYHNEFEAIPNTVPFRPPRMATDPVIPSTQTAVVVGKSGEEIWTDQYGRVKVQFFWDREGNADENSSCWIRVATGWAGKQWGLITIPRIGQEVVVSFLEGDPDRPLITGSVYNAEQMPPYTLPGDQTKSTLKSLSSKGGGGFNEIRLEDKADNEQVFIHSQKLMDIRVENDRKEWIGQDRHLMVQRDKLEQVTRDAHYTINRDLLEQMSRDHHLTIQGKENISITGDHSLTVSGNVNQAVTGNHSESVTQNYSLDAMQAVLAGKTGITLSVGGSFITINASGVQIFGPMVMINSGGSALSGTPANALSPTAPTAPLEADNAQAGSMDTPDPKGYTQDKMSLSNIAPAKGNPPPRNVDEPSHNPNSAANQQKKNWIEINLVDETGKPVPGERYKVTLPDGTVDEGTLDTNGHARVDGIDPGSCVVTFPDREKQAWDSK
jgi:type VI secretion system secreted protein VgrG